MIINYVYNEEYKEKIFKWTTLGSKFYHWKGSSYGDLTMGTDWFSLIFGVILVVRQTIVMQILIVVCVELRLYLFRKVGFLRKEHLIQKNVSHCFFFQI